MTDTKPKRTYAKKKQVVNFVDDIKKNKLKISSPDPETASVSQPEAMPKIELVEEDEETKRKKIFESISLRGYEKVVVYMYYEGNNVDVVQFIKGFQMKLDKHDLGSQVIIVSKKFNNDLRINNCYTRETNELTWKSYSTGDEEVLGIQFLKVPKMTVDAMFDFIKNNNSYNCPEFNVCEF